MRSKKALKCILAAFALFLGSLLFNGCGGGESTDGEQKSPDTVAPQNLTLNVLSSNSIGLQWNHDNSNLTVYIERSTDGNSFSQIAMISSDSTTYTAETLIAATEYHFRLRAGDGENYSAYSSIQNATTNAGPEMSCEQPTGDNLLFVDIDSICGACSDAIVRDNNRIDNAWCTLAQAMSVVLPGDTVYLREGIYPESIDIPVSGEDQNPITISSFANETATLEGGDVLAQWTQCTSAQDCGGNPNWQHIFFSYIHSSNANDVDALTANLFQGENMLAVSQEPDQPDIFYIDEIANFYTSTLGTQTSTTLTDGSVFSALDASFSDDTFVLLWVSHNRVQFRKIDSYISSSETITFEATTNEPYDDRDGKYSLFNGVQQIDIPGEYSVGYQLEQDGSRKIYLWPLDDTISSNSIRYSARKYGININRKSHVTVQGLHIQRYAGSDLTNGIGIGSVAQGDSIQGVILRNNTVRFNRHATRGYGGIYLSNCSDCVVAENSVYENVRHYGIFLNGPIRSVVKNNTVRRAGLTCITHYYAEKSQIIGNDISGCSGNHANTITVYLDSEDILIANNYIHDSKGFITLQNSSNITLYNNIVDIAGEIALSEWGGTTEGTLLIAQNTFINSSENTAITLGNNGAELAIKNNIIDGFCPPAGATTDMSNNLYTGLMWCQAERYEWSLETDGIIEENLSLVFNDLSAGNFLPLSNGPAIQNGADISSLLPNDVFPDFSFDKDYSAKIRNMTTPVIGALEP